LDDATPHVLARWLALAAVAAVYAVRVLFLVTGFYIVTYALGIYLLNLLIAFLSPSIDPSLDLDAVRRRSPHTGGRGAGRGAGR
jgi:hypothetical protein